MAYTPINTIHAHVDGTTNFLHLGSIVTLSRLKPTRNYPIYALPIELAISKNKLKLECTKNEVTKQI